LFIVRSLIFAALACALPAAAQQLELPRPSPNAKIVQQVGVTDVTVDYSSPGVKGRQVYGGVVPMDKVWRAGANATTKITFSKDVQIGETKVAAGSYGLFVIPSSDHFTFILNKDTNATQQSYKESDDVVRATAKAEQIPARERMTYLFADTTDEGTRLDLEWGTTRASLAIRAFTDAQVRQAIAELESGAWRPYNAAARYQLETKKDAQAALALVETSLKLHEHWFNVWTKAQILAELGKKHEAQKLAVRAEELGSKTPQGFFFAADVKKAIESWK
jgi:hypothetical protein